MKNWLNQLERRDPSNETYVSQGYPMVQEALDLLTALLANTPNLNETRRD